MFKLYRFLKVVISSPLASLGLPPHACRYSPSCSKYCEQAFQNYHLLKATWFCVSRIFRCHPWSKGGFDPLP